MKLFFFVLIFLVVTLALCYADKLKNNKGGKKTIASEMFSSSPTPPPNKVREQMVGNTCTII
jgi:hypothetical protein